MKQFSVGFTLSVLALAPLTACAQNTTTPTAAKPAAAKPAAAVPATPVTKTATTKLSWAPPVLVEPTTIELTNEKKKSLKLNQAKDYIIKLPATPLQGGISIWGGRNVVLIGGEIHIPTVEEVPEFKGATRALYMNQQTGTIHVEGLLIRGNGLKEGINLDQRKPDAIVQLQNVRIEKVIGTRAGHHADLIQTWAGPPELRIDHFTGMTSYQGFFLLPNQHFKEGAPPRKWDFRNMNLIGDERSAYLLWRQDGSTFPLNLKEVWLSPRPGREGNRDAFLWPKPSTGDTSWAAANIGTAPGGDFVPAGVAGVNYVSPGYVTDEKLVPIAAVKSTP